MKLVISQPMYFPWVGMFEQINLSDVFVYYDDVQFSKGSFTNRVQVKNNSIEGFKWLTVPLKGHKLGANINEIEIDNSKSWKEQHLALLHGCYGNSEYYDEMMDIVHGVFQKYHTGISDLAKCSMDAVIQYFDFSTDREFRLSSELDIPGNSSERVYKIAKFLNADLYITGHGAKNYLDHQLFDTNGIGVEYMTYERRPYPQLFGTFNPHVSILDLIANMGKEGKKSIISKTKNWKEFINES